MNPKEPIDPAPETPTPAPEANPSGQPVTEPKSTKQPKKSLLLIIAAVAVVVIIGIIVLVCVLGNGGPGSPGAGTTSGKADTISAVIGDTDAYLPLPNGECITIKEDVHHAYLTPDRTHVVALLTDQTLYFADAQLSNKTTVADDAVYISAVRDDGFIYRDAGDTYYRVAFSDASPVEIGTDISICEAENTLSVLFAKDDGTVWTLPGSSTEATKVGNYDGGAYVCGISDDGQIAVWNSRNDDEVSIIVSNNGDRTTLGTISNQYAHYTTSVNFTADQGLAVIANYYDEQIYIIKPNEEPLKVKLGSELSSYTVYTANGLLSDQRADQVEGLYVTVEADTGSNLYYVSMDGERERVASEVSSCQFGAGYLAYLNSDSTLYYAKLDGAALSEEVKVASDASRISLSKNGKYLYYMRNCEDNAGTLYCCQIGETEGVKIDSDVYCSRWSTAMPYYQISSGGNNVYYAKDVESAGGSLGYGGLYVWNYGDEKGSKLANDVMVDYLDSGLTDDMINAKGFLYYKYNSIADDDSVRMDVYYCNGSESTKLASDVEWQDSFALDISSDDPSSPGNESYPSPTAGYESPSPTAGYESPSPTAGYESPSPTAGYIP